jgi:hypothetical protein
MLLVVVVTAVLILFLDLDDTFLASCPIEDDATDWVVED